MYTYTHVQCPPHSQIQTYYTHSEEKEEEGKERREKKAEEVNWGRRIGGDPDAELACILFLSKLFVWGLLYAHQEYVKTVGQLSCLLSDSL